MYSSIFLPCAGEDPVGPGEVDWTKSKYRSLVREGRLKTEAWGVSHTIFQCHPDHNTGKQKGHYQEFCAYNMARLSHLTCQGCLSLIPSNRLPALTNVAGHAAIASHPPNTLAITDAPCPGSVPELGLAQPLPKALSRKRSVCDSDMEARKTFSLKDFFARERIGVYQLTRNFNGHHPVRCSYCDESFNAYTLTGRYYIDRHESLSETHKDKVKKLAEMENRGDGIVPFSESPPCLGIDMDAESSKIFKMHEVRPILFA